MYFVFFFKLHVCCVVRWWRRPGGIEA